MLTNQTRDRHLNLFRFYNSSERVEKNLTRALALLLQNDALFFHEFISSIIGDAHFRYMEEGHLSKIDIEVNTANLDDESIEKVYGLALTTEKIPTEDLQDEIPEQGAGLTITDLVIQFKNILIIVEVKRTSENCAHQLNSQLIPLQNKVKSRKAMTWEDVMRFAHKVRNIYGLLGQKSSILEDFHNLIASEYAAWLPTKPFKFLNANSHKEQVLREMLYKRLGTVRNHIKKYPVEYSNNRHYLKVDWNWASEVIPGFIIPSTGEEVSYLAVHVWPGNTKGQGWHVFNGRDQSWQNKTELSVNGYPPFEMSIWPQVKFSSTFGGYISELNIVDVDMKSSIHTNENFNYSGKWKRNDSQWNWRKLEIFFDDHFPAEFDWRGKCGWESNFINSDRTALSISFGFVVELLIPYDLIQKMDKDESGPSQVAGLLEAVTDGLKGLIDA